MKKFVQFPHPGPEHYNIFEFEEKKYIRWNKGEHKRKFVKNYGKYIDNGDNIQEGEINFWCEWEPQSKIVKEYSITDDKNELPKYLQKPIWDTNERVQNTDPFVFGKNFYYAFCKQGNLKKLRELKKGDLILFGSKINDKFRVDTVFVVKAFEDYNWRNYPKKLAEIIQACPEYDEITLQSGSCDAIPPKFDYRFYVGVNYDERKDNNGMYSFFPAKKYDENDLQGFKRPTIDFSKIKDYNCPYENDKLVLHGTTMGARVVCIKDEDKIKEIWNTIREQIRNKQLVEGIYTKIPKKEKVPYKIGLNKPINKYTKNKIADFDFSLINNLKIEIIFKSNKMKGGLVGCQNRDFNPSEYHPVIYIDNSGYLRAKLWDGKLKTLKTDKKVNNNKEYTAIYTANLLQNYQRLELIGYEEKTQSDKILKYNKATKSNYETNYWQIGAVFSGAYAGGNSEWFEFNGDIISAKIFINDNLHFEY